MSRALSLASGILALTLVTGCALLPSGSKKRTETVYLIEPTIPTLAASQAPDCGVIQVGIGPVATGQRGTKMSYTLTAYELNYFAYARWGNAPARMLQDQMRSALRASGAFEGVLSSPAAAETNYQLELADVSVVQRFAGDEQSELVMGFEARLYDGDRRHLLGVAALEKREPAGGDARLGVEAANRAASDLLYRARDFVLARCGGAQ